MSDWRTRAKPVQSQPPVTGEAPKTKPDWRSRAKPVTKKVAEPRDYAQISTKDSALAGAAQGGLFGFADEAMGAIKTAGDVLSGHTDLDGLSDQYAKRRDSYRKYFDESEAQNPKAHLGGELAGGTATAFIPGAGLAKGSKIASMALPSAAAGLGYSKEDTALGQFQDAAIGGATGLVAGKVFDAASNLASSAVNKFKNFAKEHGATSLLKSAGAMTSDFRRMDDAGTKLSNADWLDKKGVVSFRSGVEDAAERAGNLKREAGEEIGRIIDGADQLREEAISKIDNLFDSAVKSGQISPDQAAIQRSQIIRQVNEEFGFNPSNIAKNADDYIASRQDSPTFRKGSMNFFKEHADENRLAGEKGPWSLRKGLEEKISQRGEVGPNMTVSKGNKKRLYDWTKGELDRAVGNYERLGQGIRKMDGIPGSGFLPTTDDVVQDKAASMVSRYRDANREMAIAAEMEKMARRRASAEASNNKIGVRDLLAGGLTFQATDDTESGLLAGLASKGLRKYGNSVTGKSLWKLGKFLEGNPEAARKYGPQIQAAMRRGIANTLLVNELIAKKDADYARFLQQSSQGVEE